MNIAAFDIGGTNVRYALGSPSDGIRASPRTERTGEDIESQVRDGLGELKRACSGIDAVSVATAGPIDHADGSVKRIATLDRGTVRDIQFREAITSEGFAPEEVYVHNDTNAAAVGEYAHGLGADRETGNLMYLTFSTGISAGVVQDGTLHRGATGNAGKVGTAPIATEFAALTEKTEGCWDQVCGGTGIPALVAHLLETEERPTALRDFEEVTATDLYRTAREDEVAREIVTEVLGDLNARGVATTTLAFDPEVIAIGGGIALNNPELLLGPILDNFPKYYAEKYGAPTIELTDLGTDAELLGAIEIPTSDLIA